MFVVMSIKAFVSDVHVCCASLAVLRNSWIFSFSIKMSRELRGFTVIYISSVCEIINFFING